MNVKLIEKSKRIPGYIIYCNGEIKPGMSMVISMHGNGPEAQPGTLQNLNTYRGTKHHLPFMLDEGIVTIPDNCIVICTQIPNGGWYDGPQMEEMLIHFRTEYKPCGICLMGLSAGGGNVWRVIQQNKDNFECAVPICGAASYRTMDEFTGIKDFPIWAFDAKNDYPYTVNTIENISYHCDSTFESFKNALPDWFDIRNVAPTPADNITMTAKNGIWIIVDQYMLPMQNVLCTIFKNGGHNIWDDAYKQALLWMWIEDHTRAGSEIPPTPEPRPLKNLSNDELLMISQGGECEGVKFNELFPDNQSADQIRIMVCQEIDLRLPEIVSKVNIYSPFFKQ